MPLIDLKSELSLKRQVEGTLNSGQAVARTHTSRLLALLSSSRGLEFAAKQALLDPQTAVRRLAGITAQISIGIGIPGVGYQGKGNFRSVFNTPKRVAEAEEEQRNSVESKYYVKSPIGRQILIEPEYDQLAELDIVPFYFTILETENGEVVPAYHLAFRSFFSNISDNTTGGYSPYNFIGRGENFYTYQTYTRQSTLNFKVAAFNKDELNVIHEKVVALRKLAAPKYRGGYMQGNYVNLTIGNYFEQMPGFVTSVSVTTAENFIWEIEDRTMVLPHMMDISVSFTILESVTPQQQYRKLEARTSLPSKSPQAFTAQGASQLAPTFAPSQPTPQNFTADFSTPGYNFGNNLFDI